MVWATSFTNDSFCGSIVSGSEPSLVVISPFGSRPAPPGEALLVPGVPVHAVAMSPAIMSRDRSDHKPLLRRMHCLLLNSRTDEPPRRGYAKRWKWGYVPGSPPPSVLPRAPVV